MNTAAAEYSSAPTLGHLFTIAAERWRDRPALWIAEQTWTYGELLEIAGGIARCLVESGAAETRRPCAIFAHRSLSAYAGVVAAQLCGLPFLPLSPKFPPSRLHAMIDAGQPVAIVTDARDVERLTHLLWRRAPGTQVVIAPDGDAPHGPAALDASRAYRWREDVRPTTCSSERISAGLDDSAYIMFTSGTTGIPKGVAVRHRNVLAYLTAMRVLIDLQPHDRTSQTFDLTFDLSVHDLFVTWSAGACLYVGQDADLQAPLDMIQRHQLTSWFSVPTLAALTRHRLATASLPSLRLSLFCGEPLSTDLARLWQRAARKSVVFNLYGPTEATIAVTACKVDADGLHAGLSTVPIGAPLGEHETAIVDDAGEPVPSGEIGELLIAGTQVTAGYINDDAATRARFVDLSIDDVQRRWYRTGDCVAQHPTFGLTFHGRRDLQVKVRGYRVELLEVESVLAQASESNLVAAVPWPPLEAGGALSLVGVVCGCRISSDEIIRRCAALLPVYMVPHQILNIPTMPVNSNGKIDRKAVVAICAASLKRPAERART